MEGIITGIIFFLIELYVISHTYESEYGLIKRDSNNYRKIYGIIEGSEEKLTLTVGRLLVLIVANIISVVNILYFLFFIGWWIKRASYPEDRETACVIWRLKFDKFTKSVITKLSNLLNKEL